MKYQHQVNAPTEPVNESETILGEVSLSKVKLPQNAQPLALRQFRFRRVDVGPGGVVPLHSHTNRPAMLFIAEGEIVEYNSTKEHPVTHKAPKLVTEYGDMEHWWKNFTDKPVVIHAADLAEGNDGQSNCC